MPQMQKMFNFSLWNKFIIRCTWTEIDADIMSFYEFMSFMNYKILWVYVFYEFLNFMSLYLLWILKFCISIMENKINQFILVVGPWIIKFIRNI